MGISKKSTLAAAGLALALGLPFHRVEATPREIIILRHAEKQNAFALCKVGVERANALAERYLGEGSENSLFSGKEKPAAFFVITLHTLETAAPAAASWGLPLLDYSVVPPKRADSEEDENARTREAADHVLNDEQWDGKTVVMVWEHHRIADARSDGPGEKNTLRYLLHLNALGDQVPPTWGNDTYDYFWIVRYAPGSQTPVSFRKVKQVFPKDPSLPHNDWAKPNGLPASSGCEKDK